MNRSQTDHGLAARGGNDSVGGPGELVDIHRRRGCRGQHSDNREQVAARSEVRFKGSLVFRSARLTALEPNASCS